MADRVLRGSRLGAVSYETDRNHDLAPRQIARYRTENGEEFDVPFADDAEIPGTWPSRNGMEGTLIDGDPPEPHKDKPPRQGVRGTRTAGHPPEPKKVKPPRTHWDMLLERRTVDELDELLKERLDLIRQRRRGQRRSTAASPRPLSIRPRMPHRATLTTASRMLDPLIFDTPNSRSTKVIGTSTTVNPSLIVRQVRSIWKQDPLESTDDKSIFSSTSLRYAR